MRKGALILMLGMAATSGAFGQTLGVGSPASSDLVDAWNIDVSPNGEGLPAGQGGVAQGQLVYEKRCLLCHGSQGQGGPQDRLAGAIGSLASATPVKTVGSFWPYATTLFDYIRRAMPFDAPQTLSTEDVYAVTAYVLYLNGLIPGDGVLDAAALMRVRMPNGDGFRSQLSPLPSH